MSNLKILPKVAERLRALPLQGLTACGVLVENLNEEGIRGGLNERERQEFFGG